jgi:hypothetical protein
VVVASAAAAPDLGAHLHAQLGVEVGERLVEQEDLRVAHDGAAHRDALPLPARELARVAVSSASRPEDLRRPLHLAAPCLVGALASFMEKAMFCRTVMCG